MSDVSIDWSTAQVTADAVLRVNLTADASAPWVSEFERLVASWQSEARGQTWMTVELGGDHRAIVVRGLDLDAEPTGLQTYLSDLVRIANEGSQHERARAEQDAREAMGRHAGREADASLLTEEFRRPPAG
ncbi:MAG: hypothetical protein ACSLFR_16710 [Solirubrobacteraceae bacterium]